MTKIPARRILSSVFGRIDTAFRVAAIGFAVVALGVVLAWIAGSDATGPLAEAACVWDGCRLRSWVAQVRPNGRQAVAPISELSAA